MASSPPLPDPDDMFSDTRMSFGDHIEDLRTHLVRALIGFVIAVVISFGFAKPVLRFISAPVEAQLGAFWENYYQERQKEVVQDMQAGKYDNIPPVWMPLKLDLDDLAPALAQRLNLPRKSRPALNLAAPFVEVFGQLGVELKDPTLRWVEVKAQLTDPLPVVMALQPLQSLIAKPPALTTLSLQEAFFVYFWVALVTGFLLGSPWIFLQIWLFIAAGLYPHEKRLVNVYLPFSLGLFFVGVLGCQFFVMPKAIEILLGFNQWLGLQPDLRLNEWLGFAIMLPVVFGLSFQTPLVMMFLERIGLFSVESYRSKRRYAILFLMFFAAVITPTPDPFTMLLLGGPLCLLYELGIGLCLLYGRPEEEEGEEPDVGELVEV